MKGLTIDLKQKRHLWELHMSRNCHKDKSKNLDFKKRIFYLRINSSTMLLTFQMSFSQEIQPA